VASRSKPESVAGFREPARSQNQRQPDQGHTKFSRFEKAVRSFTKLGLVNDGVDALALTNDLGPSERISLECGRT